jgi:hypothetical protein
MILSKSGVLIISLVLGIMSGSCVLFRAGKNAEETGFTLPLAGELLSPTVTSGPVIGTEQEDVAFSAQSPGPVWRSFLLPILDETLGEASFFLGYMNDFGEGFATPPKPGTCLSAEKAPSPTGPESKKPKKLRRHIQLQGTLPQTLARVSETLFAVFDEQGGILVAMGRLSAEGTADCDLPQKNLAVSTGFGLTRVEVAAPPDKSDILLPPLERGRLRVEPGAGPTSLSGLVLRIGRELSAPRENEAPGTLRLPQGMDTDLFVSVPNPSENEGVSEMLQTTLLVGQSAFALSLEPGNYVATLARPGRGLHCVARFAIRQDAQSTLSCVPSVPAGEANSDLSANNSTSAPVANSGIGEALVDATFFPPRYLLSAQLREWMISAGLTHALVLDKETDLVGRRMASRADFSLTPLVRTIAAPKPLSTLVC